MKNRWTGAAIALCASVPGLAFLVQSLSAASLGTPLSTDEMRSAVGGQGWTHTCVSVGCDTDCQSVPGSEFDPDGSSHKHVSASFNQCYEVWWFEGCWNNRTFFCTMREYSKQGCNEADYSYSWADSQGACC
jgi:hypothetical protein